MTKILCIETSAETCSVALSKNGVCAGVVESNEERAHAKLLTVLVEQLLNSNNISINDIQAIAISEGPGSYTGLRIGVAAAKGICYGAEIPLIAISTLQILANAFLTENPNIKKESVLIPMLDARRMEVYYAKYDLNLTELQTATPHIIDESTLNLILEKKHNYLFGSGAKKCAEIIQTENITYHTNIKAHAKHMTQLAQQLFNKNKFQDTAYFEPAYLKPFVATVSKKDILLNKISEAGNT